MSNKRIWNYWSSRYDRLLMQKYSLGITRNAVIEMIKKYNKLELKEILDIGCGTGQLLEDLEKDLLPNKSGEKKVHLTGIDYSSGMLDIARSKGIDADFLLKDVSELDTIEKTFDLITCTHSLPYYPDQRKAVRDMTDLLREGGLLILAHGSANDLYDRIAFLLTKLTTGSAKYLSKKGVIAISPPELKCEEMFVLRESFWMPSILVTVFRRSKA
ncbi:MAG: class I SAM-dependent methyltransferase [Peptostreptococcaceae bacterium]|nr:class I SAM-dependent methyltransferase [Peptostreptococcaceae bacterium]